MHRLFILCFFFLITFITQATPKIDKPGVYTNCITSPNLFLDAGDTLPAVKKNGLLKKLAEAIKFRKKAKAKEQLRVLAIIDNSGLKKTLDSVNNKIVSLNTTSSAKDSALVDLQNAVKELRAMIKEGQPATGDITDDTNTAETGTPNDLPSGDKEIEVLVKQVLPLLNNTAADAQEEKEKFEKLRQLRNVMHRPAGQVDTLKQNDSILRPFSLRLQIDKQVTGFYNYQHSQGFSAADSRLINTLAWYAITFHGRTGKITGLNGYDTAGIINQVQQEGRLVTLTIINKNAADINELLTHEAAQRELVKNLIALLEQRQANGVNIYFENLPVSAGNRFVDFIRLLSDTLHTIRPDHTINVVLPSADAGNAYHPEAMSNFVDHFFVDFTQRRNNTPGPLAPLEGTLNNDISTCISRYLNKNIPPDKFILFLPYYGALYAKSNNGQFNRYIGFRTYQEIGSEYEQPVVFDKATSTVYKDIIDTLTGEVTHRIWFDNEKSLSLKYDYILQNGLGGVAIQALGFDGSYGELRDALANKFVRIDTSYFAKININPAALKPAPLEGWQWTWPYITAKFEQYHFIFAYPCETRYPRILIRRWQKAGVANNDRGAVKKEASFLFGVVSLVLLAVCLGISFLFIYQMRRLAKWKWKKWCAGILIFLCILLTSTGCMYLFLDNRITGFGASESAQDCYDFPFGTLSWFIIIGLLVGAVITRFLVFPLIRKEDIP